MGEGWAGMSVNHVLTRSVRDSAAMLEATHGPAPGDPYCAPPATETFLDEVSKPPGHLRVALQERPFSGVPVDAE